MKEKDLEFTKDIEAAKHFVNMNIIEGTRGSTHQFTLWLKPGDDYLGNRGVESVGAIGEALRQLRNEAGLNSGQIAISGGEIGFVIKTTMDNWNKLRAHVKSVEQGSSNSR